jgi:beta-N-acetylhexosaminidase
MRALGKAFIALLVVGALSTPAVASTPVVNSSKAALGDIDRRIDAMTSEEKVAQLLIVSFDGQTAGASLREMVSGWGVGGVVFFGSNVRSPEQIRTLTTRIRAMSRNGLAPFIAADQEGGTVMRVQRGAPDLPAPMALGATRSTELAFRAGAETGAALRRLGISMNFAPVLDVYGNPRSAIGTRAFSDRPELVARLGSAFIEGQSSAGVISVAKHFVGGGEAAGDSHDSTPWVRRSMAEIEQTDLAPFRDAFVHGLSAVMSSNVAVPELTSEGGLPVTLSHEALTTLLRDKLKFDGVVITDALEMESLRQRQDIGELADEAIEAGADMVLVAGTRQDRRAVFAALLHAYRAGRISEARIQTSLRRILRLKAAFQGTEPPRSIRAQGAPTDIAGQIARQSITVINDHDGILPLFARGRTTPAAYVGPDGLLRKGLGLHHVILSRKIEADDVQESVETALDSIGEARVIVCAAENRRQAKILSRIAAARPALRFVAISLGNPHDLEWAHIPSVRIAAYSTCEASQGAVLGVLRGESQPSGVLPVAIEGHRNQVRVGGPNTGRHAGPSHPMETQARGSP